MYKNLYLFVLFFLFVLLCGCKDQSGTISCKPTTKTNFEIAEIPRDSYFDEKQEDVELIYVSIYGGVFSPGVYLLKKGTRVFEAINSAGGVTEQADVSGVNLVKSLEADGQIIVPLKGIGETEQKSGTKGLQQKININSAGAGELTALSGIGPSKAADIVSYREKHGAFKTIEGIKKVPGIGDTTFERIRESITVE